MLGRLRRLKVPRRLRMIGAAAAGWVVLTVALSYLVPLPERLAQSGSVTVEFRDGSVANVALSPDEKWRVPIAREEVDPAYIEALLRLEDKRFWYHPGVDPLAVARAAWLNVRRGDVVSGGSTLTLQLVRVLEPRPRTIRSKLVEALRAVQLEVRLSKKELLEAYLQFVPYGKNVEGIEAASLAYFGHTARALSAAEVATLLAVPQDPTRRFPAPANMERLRAARDDISARLADAGALPLRGSAREAVLAEVQKTPAPSELRPFPRFAPHAAAWLRAREPERLRFRTTLDGGAQRLAEKLAARAKEGAAESGIHNASLVLVHHETGEVRALVGNFDFWDAEHGGQIPGFDRARSTGSALKPFLFAMAIDEGLALPQTLVADVPSQFGAYAPKNFDGGYAGMVKLEDALTASLNVPFVRLLGDVGVERFVGTLRNLGLESIRGQAGYYGLSAIVGGMELTPLEMAGLYATLAQNGELRTPRLLADAPPTPEQRAFSAGAAYLTKKVLARRNRPDFPAERRLTGLEVPVHWKTGTSFGHRDAWAAGSGPAFTAVVWLGNFDNTPAVGLVGASAAGPLLFDLLEGVEPRVGRPPAEMPPRELRLVEVCALSGQVPTHACPTTREVLARSDRVPTQPCLFHTKVDVEDETGLALNASCRAGRAYTSRTFAVWPADVRRWLRSEHQAAAEPPSLAPGCEPGGKREGPKVVHPQAGQGIVLVPGLPAHRQEVPLQADAASTQLSWFVDGAFFGTHRTDERVWWTPTPGQHEVVVVDEAGLSARRAFWVR